MEIKNTVLELLEEICQTDVVKENLNIELFDEGLLDSFGVVSLLMGIEEKLGIRVGISEVDREQWSTPNKIIAALENWA
ncbi:D-alanine--poly(phosphoribitol) ligase subunit 2 [Anoxybacillus voinovskiensis]|uniref:D-alanyl carrier protein n=1 Tax=Anoxybacteroides voinovskiense TaxID=230470 RepID=A0A840E0Q4_9BACL|nr:D-alanine--poly(phosphoribitol) ligase subunit DltC [Anoxybacillus voinovskiensis]MBB4075329.1 D-alanine--poly(phosphoribitol) ligase subunit 2 [Anoxybacillus voinovskiensis]GGJ77949.1 D-alanine--poly(phosphoribitol) ligase subunit 2 [Anoxybacillus voinovskiensis]